METRKAEWKATRIISGENAAITRPHPKNPMLRTACIFNAELLAMQ